MTVTRGHSRNGEELCCLYVDGRGIICEVAVPEAAVEVEPPRVTQEFRCAQGMHTFSWRHAGERCRYCGEPAKVVGP